MYAADQFARFSLSYAHGVSDIPLSRVKVGNLLNVAANRHPNNEVLVVPYQKARLTYRDLNDRATEMAAGLIALGPETGDRMGVCAPSMVEWVVPPLIYKLTCSNLFEDGQRTLLYVFYALVKLS